MRLPNDYRIDALALEASRRGVSFGQLKAQLTEEEADRICQEYADSYSRRRRRGRPRNERNLFSELADDYMDE